MNVWNRISIFHFWCILFTTGWLQGKQMRVINHQCTLWNELTLRARERYREFRFLSNASSNVGCGSFYQSFRFPLGILYVRFKDDKCAKRISIHFSCYFKLTIKKKEKQRNEMKKKYIYERTKIENSISREYTSVEREKNMAKLFSYRKLLWAHFKEK